MLVTFTDTVNVFYREQFQAFSNLFYIAFDQDFGTGLRALVQLGFTHSVDIAVYTLIERKQKARIVVAGTQGA